MVAEKRNPHLELGVAMLSIPDYTSQYVLLSQCMGTSYRWSQFEHKMSGVFAADNASIAVIPCRFDGIAAPNFTVQNQTGESTTFRGRLLRPYRWAVMYISSFDGSVYDVSDAWLSCFEMCFEIILPSYAKKMSEKRRRAGISDGVIAKVATPDKYGTSALTKVGLVATATSSQVVASVKGYPTPHPTMAAAVSRKSLRDPLNVEGCAGVDAKRDALLRRMFG